MRTLGSARRRVALCLAVTASVAAVPEASAAGPLGLESCHTIQGVHQCSGTVATWDGVPLDTTVTLPAGGGQRLPLVVELHGFGNSKHEYLHPASTAYTDNAYAWARDGYAVLTYTSRGLWGSCGTPESRLAAGAACARGYIRLADTRYEVRDTQYLVGRLVDEGVADARRIGVTGDSYGGGQSFTLAALRDRVMLPDGRLVRWRSPAGTPLRIAAAAPIIPWTDVVYAIAPNGRTLTHAITPPAMTGSPVGIEKASYASAIFASAQNSTGPGQPAGEPFVLGRPMGYLAPPGVDPEADVTAWLGRATLGEPYSDSLARSTVETLQRFHSAYHVPATRAPPPLLVGSGFTDDLFPVDEALRFTNRAARDYPRTPISLMLFDFGHQRGTNKPADRDRLLSAIHRWFDHHVRGDGPRPFRGVTALTQTCPRDAPSGGPFRARTFGELARGEVRGAWRSSQTIQSTPGDLDVGVAIDPLAGGGDACTAVGAQDRPGTATYELPPAPGGGYTLLGAPTIVARLGVDGPSEAAQVAARLWDVDPTTGSQTLVARGQYRPSGRGDETWQLHANGWRFAPGHVPKLELLGSDAPFGRPSNLPFSVEVSRVRIRLPVRERPDCRAVLAPARPVLPAGQRPAPGYARRRSQSLCSSVK